MSDLRVAIRKAVKAVLDADPYVGVPVIYRPTRRPITLPAVTMRDVGSKIDDVVPLYSRSLYLDIWTRTDMDDAEAIAHAINTHLDHQPLLLPGAEGQVAFLMLQSDMDEPQEDADLTRKTLVYHLLAYEYNGPKPFGE